MTEHVNTQSHQDFLNDAGNNSSIVFNEEGQLINNDQTTLRYDEHKHFDNKLVQIARKRLNGIEDLRSKRLVIPVGGLGTLISYYDKIGDMNDAEISVDGITRGQNDKVQFDQAGVPIPIIFKDWQLNRRQIESSRRLGSSLPTEQLALATKIVSERMEKILFNGLDNFSLDGKKIYGYTNHPNRITVSLSAHWNDTSTSDRDIVNDTKNMIKAALDNNRYGPFCMYVSRDYWPDLQMDYNDSKGEKTFRERILAFSEIENVKVADFLPNGTVLLVELTEDVIDLAVAQDISNLEWSTNPMQTQYKVFTAMAPRIKTDINGLTGIIHATV